MSSNTSRTFTSTSFTHPHAGWWPGWRAAVGPLLALGCLLVFVSEARAAEKDAPASFARVGDVVITQAEYDQAYAVAARNKFYHGKPPEGDVAKLQREVADNLVNEVLLTKEARRRKIQPDHAAVKKQIDGYEARYQGSEMWQKNKATMLPPLKKRLEEQTVLEQLQAAVRNVPDPDEPQIAAYYESHKDKFTEPEQVKLSVILLKVDPSSPQAKWDGAREEGAAIVKRLRAGADFEQLAHLHSGDPSAEKGGRMDYLHRGMLPDPAQAAIDKLKPGEIGDAVVLLEGVAVFRLDGRKSAKLNPLAAVHDRARDLLKREQSEQAWTALIARLRKDTPPRIDESRFLPLALAKPAAAGTPVR
jgi:parvulin-like peptidyl-prolyl isomerase